MPDTSTIFVPEPTGDPAIDRANIQNAIDQVSDNGGGVVVLQKGVYALEPFMRGDYRCCIYLLQGVRLVGSGMLSTVLNAINSDCHVILSDPAPLIDGQYYMTRYGISLQDFQVLAGANSGPYTGVYLNGVSCFFLKNIWVNGNYNWGYSGCHFNRGIHVKGWVGTIINCNVTDCYQGYNLSWDDDFGGLRADNTNAVEMVGCHFEGGALVPESGEQIGCYINGVANHLSGCTIERRLIDSIPETVAIHIKEDMGNTVTGCYFEGWKTTFRFDGCSGTTVTGGFMSACYGIEPVQYLNGAEAVEKANIIQNMCQGVFYNYEGTWYFIGSGQKDEMARMSLAPYGTVHDNGYNGSVVITKPPASGQYINMIRAGNFPWSIGMVYDTNTFAIGSGQDQDSNFINPFLAIQIDGKAALGGISNPDTLLHLAGNNAALTVAQTGNTPAAPGASDRARIYIKGNKLVIQFKDGAYTRYKWLPLTGSSISWQQSTIAP